MSEPDVEPGIYVLAGVNGAGKSSIFAATFMRYGIEPFNPDAATAELTAANPGLSLADANALAWNVGKELLEQAIAERKSFAFETTLGGATVTALLDRALRMGQSVYMSFVGLEGVDRHIARVRARVALGGHDVPEERIRQRYVRSRMNLIRLLTRLTELRVYDNSSEADPTSGHMPAPIQVLHTVLGRVVSMMEPSAVPEWAKSVVAAAFTGGDEKS